MWHFPNLSKIGEARRQVLNKLLGIKEVEEVSMANWKEGEVTDGGHYSPYGKGEGEWKDIMQWDHAQKKPEPEVQQRKSIPLVVQTASGGAFFGVGDPADAPTIRLEQCQMCVRVRWRATDQSLMMKWLALNGPDADSQVTSPVPVMLLQDITLVLEAAPKAVKAWQKAPWAKTELEPRDGRWVSGVERDPAQYKRFIEAAANVGIFTIQMALSIKDAGMRQLAIEAFGLARLFSQKDVKIIHQDIDGVGNARQLLSAFIVMKQGSRAVGVQIQAVRVICPTTGHEYYLGVKNGVRTCQEAVASTFGLKPNEYKPVRES
jgi:hypothetical protein